MNSKGTFHMSTQVPVIKLKHLMAIFVFVAESFLVTYQWTVTK